MDFSSNTDKDKVAGLFHLPTLLFNPATFGCNYRIHRMKDLSAKKKNIGLISLAKRLSFSFSKMDHHPKKRKKARLL
jgi:hypothetical protein